MTDVATNDDIDSLMNELDALTSEVADTAQPEAKAEEAPKEEAKAEEAPAPEAKAEEAPKEEAKAEEAPAPEAKAEEAPKEEAKAEEAPAPEAKAEEAPKEEAKAEEAPAPEAKAEEAPKEEAKAEEAPAPEAKAEEAPKEEAKAEPAPAASAAVTSDSQADDILAEVDAMTEDLSSKASSMEFEPAAKEPQLSEPQVHADLDAEVAALDDSVLKEMEDFRDQAPTQAHEGLEATLGHIQPEGELHHEAGGDSNDGRLTLSVQGTMALTLKYEHEGQEVTVCFKDEHFVVELADGTEFRVPVRKRLLRAVA